MTVLSITALFVCLVLCCSGSSSIGSNNKSFVLAQPAAEEAETVVAADASSASTSGNDAQAQASPFQDLISSDASVSETEVAALKELGAGLLAWYSEQHTEHHMLHPTLCVQLTGGGGDTACAQAECERSGCLHHLHGRYRLWLYRPGARRHSERSCV